MLKNKPASRAVRSTLLLVALLVLTGCASRAYKPDSSVPLFVPLPAGLADQIGAPDILVGIGQNTLMLGDQGKLWKPPPPPPPVDDASAPSAKGKTKSWLDGGGVSLPMPSSDGAAVIVVLVVATVILTVWSAQQGYEEYSYYMADRAIAPVRSSLQTYSFGDQLRAALDENGRATLRLSDGQVSLVAPATPEQMNARLQASAADSAMLVSVNYMMSPDLKRLQIVAEAKLFPKAPALSEAHQVRMPRRATRPALATDPANALYRRIVYFNTQLPTDAASRDQAAQVWSQRDGAHIRAALDMGSQAIAQILVADLQRPAEKASLKRQIAVGDTQLVVQSDERGVLHVSIPPSPPTQASAGSAP